jgi:hypothetical protein
VRLKAAIALQPFVGRGEVTLACFARAACRSSHHDRSHAHLTRCLFGVRPLFGRLWEILDNTKALFTKRFAPIDEQRPHGQPVTVFDFAEVSRDHILWLPCNSPNSRSEAPANQAACVPCRQHRATTTNQYTCVSLAIVTSDTDR